MEYALAIVVFAIAVALVVMGPLRRGDRGEPVIDARREDLEAAKEAKYREIRDAELDHGTGKLSDADFEALDSTLRAEALEILNALDRAREESLPS